MLEKRERAGRGRGRGLKSRKLGMRDKLKGRV